MRSFWKVLTFLAVLLLLSIVIIPSQLHFRMDDDELNLQFEQEAFKPEIAYFQDQRDTLRYLYLNQNKSLLLVFVHGSPGGLDAFLSFFKDPNLNQKADIISIDRPGYGFSQYGHAMTSLNGQAEALSKIIRTHKNGRKTILIGHSLGASIVGKIAADFPDLVDGAVLVSGPMDPRLEVQEWHRTLQRSWFGRLILSPALQVSNEEIFDLQSELEQMVGDWNDISCPIIAIHGDDDALVPVENIQFLIDHLDSRNARVVVVPDANHFIPWNEPQLITNAVLQLIKNLN